MATGAGVVAYYDYMKQQKLRSAAAKGAVVLDDGEGRGGTRRQESRRYSTMVRDAAVLDDVPAESVQSPV